MALPPFTANPQDANTPQDLVDLVGHGAAELRALKTYIQSILTPPITAGGPVAFTSADIPANPVEEKIYLVRWHANGDNNPTLTPSGGAVLSIVYPNGEQVVSEDMRAGYVALLQVQASGSGNIVYLNPPNQAKLNYNVAFPDSSDTGLKVTQLGPKLHAMISSDGDYYILRNLFYDASTDEFKYLTNGPASYTVLTNNTYVVYTTGATAGVAGAVATGDLDLILDPANNAFASISATTANLTTANVSILYPNIIYPALVSGVNYSMPSVPAGVLFRVCFTSPMIADLDVLTLNGKPVYTVYQVQPTILTNWSTVAYHAARFRSLYYDEVRAGEILDVIYNSTIDAYVIPETRFKSAMTDVYRIPLIGSVDGMRGNPVVTSHATFGTRVAYLPFTIRKESGSIWDNHFIQAQPLITGSTAAKNYQIKVGIEDDPLNSASAHRVYLLTMQNVTEVDIDSFGGLGVVVAVTYHNCIYGLYTHS